MFAGRERRAQAWRERGGGSGRLPTRSSDLFSSPLLPHQTVDVDFGLADQVFTRATIRTDVPGVALWLGAGVSVEYPLDEAAELLTHNAANADANLAAVERDLALVRDCVTTTHVSMSRVYNYSVAAGKGR